MLLKFPMHAIFWNYSMCISGNGGIPIYVPNIKSLASTMSPSVPYTDNDDNNADNNDADNDFTVKLP